MRTTDLTSGWEFRQIDARGLLHPPAQGPGWMQATVPGHVHRDLQFNGLIPDPFESRYEAGLRWVDEASWGYRTHFEWHAVHDLPRRVIRFEGLDTVATVFLNGEEIGRSDNMFLPLEIDVSGALKDGENELRVDFASAVRTGDERRRAYFELEGLPWETHWFDERAFVRKAAYMSGWDWGPRLVSCGIWQPVRLLEFASRIKGESFLQERLEDGRFRVWVEADVEGDARFGAAFDGTVRSPGEKLEWFVENPKLWWPNGAGPVPTDEPHLYEARVFLQDGSHEIRKRIGLRTIELIREPDEHGVSFHFRVNGHDLYARGANWIPNDSFLSCVSDEDMEMQIRTCAALNMNMLRVWGGGICETEAFYDACDEYGILVWQDFPYACGHYPDSEEHLQFAEVEAQHHIRRLRDRASLALWCGNNENSVMWEQNWGAGHGPPRFYGEAIYNEVLPALVRELDPQRPYIPSSPLLPGKPMEADDHYWDVWHGRGDWKFYEESKTRFSSEFGFASSCSLLAWCQVLDESEAQLKDPTVRWHDKTNKPWDTFRGYVELHYPQSETLEDWVYYSQLNQRDALRHGIEHYRRSVFCKGTLIWQFNDCWPVQSWAVQDYARLVKPAGFDLHRLYAPQMLSIEVLGDEAVLHLVNDSHAEYQGAVSLLAVSTLSGEVLKVLHKGVSLQPGARGKVLTMSLSDLPKNSTVLAGHLENAVGSLTYKFLVEPKDLEIPAPQLIQAGITNLIVDPDGSPQQALFLQFSGFVADLVATDPHHPYNIFDLTTNEPGWKAYTVANGSIMLGLRSTPRKPLKFRSLGGTFEVDLTN